MVPQCVVKQGISRGAVVIQRRVERGERVMERQWEREVGLRVPYIDGRAHVATRT